MANEDINFTASNKDFDSVIQDILDNFAKLDDGMRKIKSAVAITNDENEEGIRIFTEMSKNGLKVAETYDMFAGVAERSSQVIINNLDQEKLKRKQLIDQMQKDAIAYIRAYDKKVDAAYKMNEALDKEKAAQRKLIELKAKQEQTRSDKQRDFEWKEAHRINAELDKQAAAERRLIELRAKQDQVRSDKQRDFEWKEAHRINEELDRQSRELIKNAEKWELRHQSISKAMRIGQEAEAHKINNELDKQTRELEKQEEAIRAQEMAYQQLRKEIRKTIDESLRQEGTNKAVVGISRGLSPSKNQATSFQQLSLQKALIELDEFARKSKFTGQQITEMWARISKGGIKYYGNDLDKLQAKLLGVKLAHDNLGKAKEKVDDLTISWHSFSRLVAVQLTHRVISRITTELGTLIDHTITYEKRLAEVQTVSQRNQLTIDQWSNSLTNLSSKFGLDILDVVEANYEALSNQIAEGAESFTFLEKSAKLAIATVSSLEDTVNILTAVMNSYGKSLIDVDEVSATLFKLVDLGRVRLKEIANTFGQVAVPAEQLGITFDELVRSIEVLTIRGIKYRETATQIRGVIDKLLNPTEAMKALFAELGVFSGEMLVAGYGLVDVFNLLENATGGSSTELRKLINRQRGLNFALALTGTGMMQYKKNLEEAKSAQEDFENAIGLVLATRGKQLETELTQIKNFFLNDLGRGAINNIADLAGGFENLDKVVKTLTRTIINLLVPALVVAVARFGAIVKMNLPLSIIVGTLSLISVGLALIPRKIDTIQKRVADLTAEHRRLLDVQTENIRLGFNEFEKVYDRMTKTYIRAIAEIVKKDNKSKDDRIKNIDEFGTYNKRILKEMTEQHGQYVNEISGYYNKLKDNIISAKEEIRDLKMDAPSQRLDLALQFVDDPLQKNAMISDEAKRLRELSYDAAKNGDLELFNNLRDQIGERFDQYNDNRFDFIDQIKDYIKDLDKQAQEYFSKNADPFGWNEYQTKRNNAIQYGMQYQETFRKESQSELNVLIAEEIRLKELLIRKAAQLAEQERVRLLQQQFYGARVDAATQKYSNFDYTKATAGDSESSQANINEQINNIDELIRLQQEAGVDFNIGALIKERENLILNSATMIREKKLEEMTQDYLNTKDIIQTEIKDQKDATAEYAENIARRKELTNELTEILREQLKVYNDLRFVDQLDRDGNVIGKKSKPTTSPLLFGDPKSFEDSQRQATFIKDLIEDLYKLDSGELTLDELSGTIENLRTALASTDNGEEGLLSRIFGQSGQLDPLRDTLSEITTDLSTLRTSELTPADYEQEFNKIQENIEAGTEGLLQLEQDLNKFLSDNGIKLEEVTTRSSAAAAATSDIKDAVGLLRQEMIDSFETMNEYNRLLSQTVSLSQQAPQLDPNTFPGQQFPQYQGNNGGPIVNNTGNRIQNVTINSTNNGYADIQRTSNRLATAQRRGQIG